MFDWKIKALLLAGLIAGLPLLTLGGVTYLESQRWFCNACHLPEGRPLHEAKMQRALKAARTDLTGAHFALAGKDFNCATCHKGRGLAERSRVMWNSALNTAQYFFAEFEEPEKLAAPLSDTNCTACHQVDRTDGDISRFHGINAHFKLKVVACTDCHRSHSPAMDDVENAAWLKTAQREACTNCHKGRPLATPMQAVLDRFESGLLHPR